MHKYIHSTCTMYTVQGNLSPHSFPCLFLVNNVNPHPCTFYILHIFHPSSICIRTTVLYLYCRVLNSVRLHSTLDTLHILLILHLYLNVQMFAPPPTFNLTVCYFYLRPHLPQRRTIHVLSLLLLLVFEDSAILSFFRLSIIMIMISGYNLEFGIFPFVSLKIVQINKEVNTDRKVKGMREW